MFKSNKDESRTKRAYASIGRVVSKTTAPLIRAVYGEKHVRVRVLILSDTSEVLLVRSWLGSQRWNLPGGGIKSTETPEEAAVREVYEETGLRIAVDDLQELGTFPHPEPKRNFTLACFRVGMPKREPQVAKHRKLEMLDVSWFPLSSLPRDRGETVDMAVALLS
jgi:8-oxo-dGTP pyrophosphatase MutT (NUDIX family)